MKAVIKPFIIYAANDRLHEVGKLCEEAGFKFTGDITSSIEPKDTMVHSLRAGGTECEYHSDCTYRGAEDAVKFNYPSDLKAIRKHLGLVGGEIYYYESENGWCKERCQVRNSGVNIGSSSCQSCEFYKDGDHNSEPSWLICSRITEASAKLQQSEQPKLKVAFTPLPEFTGFGVKGSKSLLKAIIEEAKILGWKLHEEDNIADGCWFNLSNTSYDLPIGEFWTNDECSPTSNPSEIIFELPSEWNEAVECLKLIKPKETVLTLQELVNIAAEKLGVESNNIKIKM